MRHAIIFLIIAQASAAELSVIEGFPKAREESAKSGRPLAVLVHGSSWHRASRTFAGQVWHTPAFRSALEGDFILTDIDVPQNLSEDGQKAFDESVKGWDPKSFRSSPAIQVYGPDGHLIKSLSGGELREAATPGAVAAKMNAIGSASRERDRLLREIAELKDKPDSLAARIDALNRLPLNPEAEAAKKFAALDPSDRYGWAARLELQDWEFLRSIGDRIREKKTDGAMAEVEALLAKDAYTAEQRCLILAAKGMLLAVEDRHEEAWETYEEAWRLDPGGPRGKAVIRHAHRTTGSLLRNGVSPNSPFFRKPGLENLTRDHATVNLSSSYQQGDQTELHASLFKGPMKDFAIHTAEENGPFAVIDLGALCRIDAVEIWNCLGNQQRAAGLTLWVSEDGESWQSRWQAEKVELSWSLAFGDGEKPPLHARYLKLGLPAERKDYLHLRAVNVFGERPDGGH